VTIRDSAPQPTNPPSPPHVIIPRDVDPDDSDDQMKNAKWKGKGRDFESCGEPPVLEQHRASGSTSRPSTGSPRAGPSTPTRQTANHDYSPPNAANVPPTPPPESPSRTRRDPLSHLSALQRDIYLRVCEADPPSLLYTNLLIDSSPNEYQGVDLRVMTRQYQFADPDLFQ
jgi:hypothetical protein